jgi:hypothetical protein
VEWGGDAPPRSGVALRGVRNTVTPVCRTYPAHSDPFPCAHDAIRTELDALVQRKTALDTPDPDDVAAVRERFDFFETDVGIHDEIEDAGLYPALGDHREGASEDFEWTESVLSDQEWAALTERVSGLE